MPDGRDAFENQVAAVTATTRTPPNQKEENGQQQQIIDELEEQEGRIEELVLYRLDYQDDTGGKKSQTSSPSQSQPLQILVDETHPPRKRMPRAAGGEILQPGDHVYMWCTLYQHHGIVLETFPAAATTPNTAMIQERTAENSDNNSHLDQDDDTQHPQHQQQPIISGSSCSSILIAEFTNAALEENNIETSASLLTSASTAAGATSGGGVSGGFRMVVEQDPHLKWHKVKYNANPIECMTWRPGTCSSAAVWQTTSQILMRVQFLKECSHLIPDYHILASNCETVAVWCVTGGKWETLQGDRAMQLSALGVAPVGGVVGLAAAAGLALWRSLHIGKQWEDTAALLNREYEW
eukprot:CAMPEP_0119020120 /NCGR_PEP_ID=MMETSP1176-20130426/23369_1 /TAXON_ID=265551 /ORGANISM="Synedropsis recta cf, Strain CCMP1620" /LENGTH=351 /DNA_ID=CAMNT_0006974503 /DNA_START=146 /DNA_END=1198 /DNA_ORIENTATION=+